MKLFSSEINIKMVGSYNIRFGIWGVVRGDSHTFFFEVVEDRTRTTLIELIKYKVAAESTIIADCWRGYLGLESICVDMGYAHETVNHSNNFVDSETGAHTQTIEGMWSVMKRELLYRNGLHEEVLEFLKIVTFLNFLNDEQLKYHIDNVDSADKV